MDMSIDAFGEGLRRVAGEDGFRGGCNDYYIIPPVYPDGLAPDIQRELDISVPALNVAIYGPRL